MKTIILTLILVSSAFAQDFTFNKEKGRAEPNYIGELKILKGKAFKKTAESVSPVKTGDRFRKDDIIITEEKSFAKILIVDETLLSIGSKSELRFDNLDFVDKNDRNLSLTLVRGQLTGNVRNKDKKPDAIMLRTTYTAMGVRGTYILMNQKTVDNLDVVQYALLSGKATVKDQQGKEFAMEPGDNVTLVHDTTKKTTESDQAKLPETERKRLESPELDEEKGFKPFLPYYDQLTPGKESQVSDASSVNEGSSERRENKPHWSENLKKLNEKLRENQKRKK